MTRGLIIVAGTIALIAAGVWGASTWLGDAPREVTTTSEVAYESYQEGEGYVERYALEPAAAAFEAAVEADSTFAMAHLQLSGVLWQLGRRDDAQRHLERAVDLSAGVSEIERMWIERTHARYTDRPERVREITAELAETHPEHPWVLRLLGEQARQRGEYRKALTAFERALELDPEGSDVRMAQALALPPFGRFLEFDALVERMRNAPGNSDGRRYVGWCLRSMGRVREALEETERSYELDPLSLMSANMVALARMAAGHVDEAVPVFADLVERAPGMSFPVACLLRAYAFQQDWDAVDRTLALAEKRQLREFRDGLPFIRAKRDPSAANVAAWWSEVKDYMAMTGSIDVARLVYSAHLGLVDEAYQAAGTAALGPTGTAHDTMGPDGYRPTLMFQAGMPELRNDRRFPRLCARLGLVELWLATGKWPDCADDVPYDFRAECELVRDVPKEQFGFEA